jgi:outer membrane protein assembly factor BamC
MDTPRIFVNPLFFNAMPHVTFKRTATVLALASLLGGCSVLQEDKINYKSAAKAPTLEIPPDLTQLRKESRYALESTSTTASDFQNAGSRVVDAGTAANALGPVRIERQGNQRWLVTSLPADKVWEPLREFWTSNGFVLTTDAPDIGVMETDWAENRAKLPQDFIRRTLGKVLDTLYSTGERDKFRTRVERNAQGGVEIYVTHRGMIENYSDSQKTSTIWQPRPSDAELEIEFLRRLMVKLGTSPEAAKTATAAASATDSGSQVTRLNGQPVILIQDNLDRAWRRTGVALDRSGFTVEDRDRSAGVYFVRFVAAGTTAQPKGFIGRLFGSNKDTPSTLTKYQINLTSSADNQSTLRVLTASGQPEPSAQDAERILKLIAAELR